MRFLPATDSSVLAQVLGVVGSVTPVPGLSALDVLTFRRKLFKE